MESLFPKSIPKKGIKKCIQPTILAKKTAFLFVIFRVPTLSDRENVSIDKAIPIIKILNNSCKEKTS